MPDDDDKLTRAWVLTELRGLFRAATEESVKLKCLELLLENAPTEKVTRESTILEQAREQRHGKKVKA